MEKGQLRKKSVSHSLLFNFIQRDYLDSKFITEKMPLIKKVNVFYLILFEE